AVDRVLRDLVEEHTAKPLAVAFLVAELLRHVPRDRFTLTVGVGREDDLVDVVGIATEVLDDLSLPADRHVLRLEAVLDVHTELARWEVADVADRGADAVVAAQILADRLRLRGRLDDHEMLRFSHSTMVREISGAARPSASMTRSARP